jgi:hypothetical protein
MHFFHIGKVANNTRFFGRFQSPKVRKRASREQRDEIAFFCVTLALHSLLNDTQKLAQVLIIALSTTVLR